MNRIIIFNFIAAIRMTYLFFVCIVIVCIPYKKINQTYSYWAMHGISKNHAMMRMNCATIFAVLYPLRSLTDWFKYCMQFESEPRFNGKKKSSIL